MKRILLAITLAGLLAVPVVSLAVEPLPETVTTPEDIITLIETIAAWLFWILLAVALIYILMAALQFLTSGGDPMRVEKARNNLLYAIVGLAVAFLAQGLVRVVEFIIL